MKQLTLGDIINVIVKLKNSGMTGTEIVELPVYLGNDEEMNGIHTGYFCELIDSDDEEDCAIELINEDSCNVELKGKGILIS